MMLIIFSLFRLPELNYYPITKQFSKSMSHGFFLNEKSKIKIENKNKKRTSDDVMENKIE